MKFKATLRNNFGTLVTLRFEAENFANATLITISWRNEHSIPTANIYKSLYVQYEILKIEREEV